MKWPEAIYQKVNKSGVTDHFNKILEGEEKRLSIINFVRLAYFNNFPNDYYILGGGLYQISENHHFM